MSMVSTLGKIAVGIMVAKGVGKMVGGSSGSGGGGIGDLIGGLMGGKSTTNSTQSGGGNISDMLGGLLGGGAAAGGLGGLLNSLTGGNSDKSAEKTAGTAPDNALSDLLSKAFSGEETTPEPTEEEKARILLGAMIAAAKSDGVLDDHEREQITKFVGDDVTPQELAFIKEELDKPLDPDAVIKSIPADMAQEAYVMSVLAINLDHPAEAEYLDKLARGLHIKPEVANAIHEKLNAPKLYKS